MGWGLDGGVEDGRSKIFSRGRAGGAGDELWALHSRWRSSSALYGSRVEYEQALYQFGGLV